MIARSGIRRDVDGYLSARPLGDTHRSSDRPIIEAERLCVLEPSIRSDYPRVLQTQIVSLAPGADYLHALSVIRAPRYAVRKREAPKRPTLIRRLWSVLR